MSLDPLKNPLERLKSLPSGMNWRKNPATNEPYWSNTIQYYANDVVLSINDEGAYVMSGSGNTLDESETAVRGGQDPAVDATGNWISLAPSGLGKANYIFAEPTMSAAGGNITITGANLVRPAVPINRASEIWMASMNFKCIGAAGTVFGDALTITFDPVGGSGAAITVSALQKVGGFSPSMTATVVLTAGSTGVVVTGAYAGQLPTSFTDTAITWIRIQ